MYLLFSYIGNENIKKVELVFFKIALPSSGFFFFFLVGSASSVFIVSFLILRCVCIPVKPSPSHHPHPHPIKGKVGHTPMPLIKFAVLVIVSIPAAFSF